MNKIKLVVGVILVLLVGALAGSLVTGLYLKDRMERFASGGSSPHLRKIFMKRLSNKLDLTEQQRIAIGKIVKESQSRIFAVRRKYLPDLRDINDQSFAMIKEKLNPEQKEKLDVFYDKLINRHSRAFIQSVQIEETPGQILDLMKERLNLTQEQVRKVQPIIEDSIKKRRKVIEKYKGKNRPDFFSLRHEIRELQESVKKPLAQILTEQQMEEYLKSQKEDRRRIRSEKRRRKMDDLNR